MYQVQDWAEVHRLFVREGWPKVKIAEKFWMSRNTVARLLVLEGPPRYERRQAGSKLNARVQGVVATPRVGGGAGWRACSGG